jgi:cation diffusion facilitator family transporter
MKPQHVSLISVFTNIGLGGSKLIFGFMTGSAALIADGIHSSLDVFSSFITFLGLQIAKKPEDEKHPYGHWRAETLAGFFVALILGISGIWITIEAIGRFFGEGVVKLNLGAIIVVIASVIFAEILARLKFYYGRKYRSLSLVADAEHSRADAISSVGVLGGLFFIQYFVLADAIIALGIGIYIIFEAFKIGREITDSLLDVSDKDTEERVRKICSSHQIELSSLKTRRIGAFNSAELKIKVPPKLKVEDVQKIIETLEERLLNNIPELKQVVISIEAYNVTKNVVLPKLGKKIGVLEGFEKIGPEKKGERIIIPLEGEEIGASFGTKQYLVLDKNEGEVILEEKIENPYFKEDSPKGSRFAKAIRADKIVTFHVGDNAKQGLENTGIEIEIISPKEKLEEVVGKIRGKKNL